MSDKALTYEDAKRELTEIVAKLQAGNLTLDQSVVLFTRGTELAGFCMSKLDETERRITKVTALSDKEITEEDFLPNEQ